MLRKINILLLVAIVGLFSSCMDDQGNYDYKEINDVEFNGIADSYTVLRFDDFNIKPEIKFTLDTEANPDRYTYKWQVLPQGFFGKDDLIDLSTEKDLVMPATIFPGKYAAYYFVNDAETGIEWQYDFNLTVENNLYEGWMVLNDVNGASRLDMISKLNNEYTEIHDVLKEAESELVLSGSPGFVYCYPYDHEFYGVYVSTSGNGTTKLHPDVFSWQQAFNIKYEFASKQPIDLEVDNIVGVSRRHAFAVKDNDVYWYYGAWSYRYNLPVNLVNGEKFSASPMIAPGGMMGPAIIYDNTNKRFVKFAYGSCSTFSDPGDKFDFNTGMDLVYMAGSEYNTGYSANHVFAILKDTNTSKSYIASFNAGTSFQLHYGEITATDFDMASHYAFDPVFGDLFYAVGSKVYRYEYVSNITTLMFDKTSEEISLLKFNQFGSGPYDELEKLLVVGSYDPSGTAGSNGKLELYSVPSVNGVVELEETYSGFGKIVSIAYRER